MFYSITFVLRNTDANEFVHLLISKWNLCSKRRIIFILILCVQFCHWSGAICRYFWVCIRRTERTVIKCLAKIGELFIMNSDRRSDDRKYVCGSLATPQGTVDGYQSGQKTEGSSVTFSYPRWPPIKAYLQSVVLKTRHSKTKTEARSTQNSKTKHPNLENEAPKSRKRSTQNSKPL